MALTRSFVRNAAMTPLDARLMNMASLVCNADGSPRTGVLGGANASIVSAKATWHFRVQAAEFATSKGKADGVTLPTNDGVVDVPIAAGAPASNSRIDVLWVKHEDNTTGDTASLPIFGVTSGAAAASPDEPAIPTGALRLATLRAYASTTGASGGANVLTNVYQMTATRGGIVPFRTSTELAAWATAVEGQLAFTLDNDGVALFSGGEWTVPGPRALVRSRLQLSAINTWTNQTSYADFPNATDKAALDGTFVKIAPGSKLLVTLNAISGMTAGVSQSAYWGINLGGVDYDIARAVHPQATTPKTRLLMAGIREIAGLAAGAYAVKPRFKAQTASGFDTAPDDMISYSVTEIQ